MLYLICARQLTDPCNGRLTTPLRNIIEVAKEDVITLKTTFGDSIVIEGNFAKLIVRTEQFGPPSHSFQAYAVSMVGITSRSEGR